MQRSHRHRLLVSILCLVFCGLTQLGAGTGNLPFLSPVFSDNMVLQRGKPNTFWGWGAPGQTVTVEIDGRHVSAEAASDGKWTVQIEPPAAGGPYEVVVSGAEKTVLRNVLVGDVWLCSGQSNMQWPLAASENGPEEVAKADWPRIRFFRVPQQSGYSPKSITDSTWKVCTPATAAQDGGLSAVAYYFATRVQQEIDVPIGLIQSAVGGSPAESWMSAESLGAFPEFAPLLEQIRGFHEKGLTEYGNFITHWYDEYDVGAREPVWSAEDVDTSGWTRVSLPGGFEELGVGATPSVCYFRREVTLPETLPPGVARIRLGVVEKMDTTFVNGTWVGASSWVENPRFYPIPEGVLRPGRNVVTLRVFKLKPDGGFQSPASELYLQLGDGSRIPLAGEWSGRVSVDARPPHALPTGFENYPTIPAVLYNGMIAPFAPMALTGALWYQGEANSQRAGQYRTLLPALIGDWRAAFQQGDFPFYIVSLPAFMQREKQPGEAEWAELREAQWIAARSVPRAEVAVTIDTGEADDIHPKGKRPVGERLARIALAKHYGRELPYSGPRFERAVMEGDAMRLHFSGISGQLEVPGGAATGFAIAGEDRVWRWAEATLDGNTVVVRSPDVPAPVAARYAWAANPEASLFDSAGLPAMPFRTDDWSAGEAP